MSAYRTKLQANEIKLRLQPLRRASLFRGEIELAVRIKEIRFFGYFYGKPGSKSLKALLCRHFIENMKIIVYNPCPVRVLLSSILNHHKRDARARNSKYTI